MLRKARRDAVTDARRAFWNLVYAHRAHVITAEMVDLLEHLDGVAGTQYESGKTSYQDVVKIRIQRETLAHCPAAVPRHRLTQAQIHGTGR